MKITLNTTIRPVGFDYARALCEAGSLQTLVSAFPRFAARKGGGVNGLPIRYCSSVQTLFIVAQRLAGANAFTRWLSHLSKVQLDGATARLLGGADAVVFYSGAGLRTIRAARRRGILSVCQMHHSHVLEQETILQREAGDCAIQYAPIYSPSQVAMQVKEYDEVDVILCPSEAVKESFIRRGTDGAKLIVVPHGIKLPEHFPEGTQAHDAGKVRILYTGQIHYRKGLRYLLGALTQTANSALTCRLVGPDFGLSGIDWSQYADIVQKTGPKKGADLWQEYAAADIFVLPSVEEGFGLVVLEAMRAGLPVLITSAVGAKDFVRDGVDGFIVPPRSPEALKEKIVWLLDHPEDRRRMGESARQQANSVQGWDDSATKLVRELVERRKLSVKH